MKPYFMCDWTQWAFGFGADFGPLWEVAIAIGPLRFGVEKAPRKDPA